MKTNTRERRVIRMDIKVDRTNTNYQLANDYTKEKNLYFYAINLIIKKSIILVFLK